MWVDLCNRLVLGWSRRSGRPSAHPILPFHAAFIEAAYSPGIEIAALSCPRGSAKTWIAAELARLAMTPDSPTWEPNIEVLVVSASFEQSRILLGDGSKASMGERGRGTTAGWTPDSALPVRTKRRARSCGC